MCQHLYKKKYALRREGSDLLSFFYIRGSSAY